MYSEVGRAGGATGTTVEGVAAHLRLVGAQRAAFCEELEYNLLLRWFLDMNLMERSFDLTVFTKNRRRLLEHRAAQALVDQVIWEAARRGLLSDEHFSVDGTLIEAPASNAVGRPGGSGHGVPGRSGENGVPARQGRNAVEVDLPPDLPRIMADRRRIVQALGNLLSSAALARFVRHPGERGAG